ncbi:hypothetical protein EJB05_07532, partial [Eragrostis curvula]
MPGPAFPPPPSWAILGSTPRVSAADSDLPPGAHLALALTSPPRVSLLTIPPRIFLDAVTTTAHNRPSILAADPSGLLLLHSNQGRATGPYRIRRCGYEQGGWREFEADYFVLDAASASALALPDAELLSDKNTVGIMLAPGGGGHYVVAELQPIIGRGARAVLLCFASDVGEWVMKDVSYPVPSRLWWPAGVLSHYGRLWWVDLSFGLIACDPSVDAPSLAFVPLPSGKVLRYRGAAGVLDRYRHVGVSAGKLRFVDMYRNRDARGAFKVSVWTLLDPDSTEWALEHEARFRDIWADQSYKAAGLPVKLPVLALIHPMNPAVVYFFLDEYLFAVDLVACNVVECKAYELATPPGDVVSTRSVHAWELPRALSSGHKHYRLHGNQSCSVVQSSDSFRLESQHPAPHRLLQSCAALLFLRSPRESSQARTPDASPNHRPGGVHRRDDMPPPSSPPSWVILGSVPGVCTADAGLPPGADFALALAPSPRVSLLSIAPSIFPDATIATSLRHGPFVLAADSSGLLLLQANQGRTTGPIVIDRPVNGYYGTDEFVPGFFVLDAASATALALPDPVLINDQFHLGLILDPRGGGHYMVAELQPIGGADYGFLFCFASDVGEWVRKTVPFPYPRRWFPRGVLSHYGRLWWVDLSFGIITCDPFADEPVLAFVPLPPGLVLHHKVDEFVLDKYRDMRVSAGKLRFVDMYRNRDRRGAIKVSVWTLSDPDSTEWALELEVSFPDIWADQSYKATGLPNMIPALALIHPENPAVVYFFLMDSLFAVDLRAHKIVECEAYDLVATPKDIVSSRVVHAWKLPRALSSGDEDNFTDGEFRI